MAGSLGDVHGIIDIEHADPSSGFKYMLMHIHIFGTRKS